MDMMGAPNVFYDSSSFSAHRSEFPVPAEIEMRRLADYWLIDK